MKMKLAEVLNNEGFFNDMLGILESLISVFESHK